MRALGIDLGTSNSCAAIVDARSIRLLDWGVRGGVILPSVVASHPDGRWLLGDIAKSFEHTNVEHTYTSTKRIIGRRYDDVVVREQIGRVAYDIRPADNGEAWIVGRDGLMPPIDVAAMILRHIKEQARKQSGHDITKAVIAVPAMFDDEQLAATKQAGEVAGLDVLRVIREPTAAALHHGVERDPSPQTLAVFDLGGGTFDVSIMRVSGAEGYEVECSFGDPFLGGDDWDAAMVAHLVAQHGDWIVRDPVKRQRIYREVERVKCELSYLDSAPVQARYHGRDDDNRTLHFETTISRAEMETITRNLAERTLAPCRSALEASGLERVDTVVLVGGMTRMPLIQEMARTAFPGATMISGDEDRAIAMGAAMAAQIEMGLRNADLMDVAPHAITLEAADGSRIEMVAAQARVPCEARRIFSTAHDNQDAVTVRLYQGDELRLGQFHLERLPMRKRGEPRIEVSVEIDANGQLSARAKELTSGRTSGSAMALMSGMDRKAIERLRERVKKREIDMSPQPIEQAEPEDEPATEHEAEAPPSSRVVVLRSDGLHGVDEDDFAVVEAAGDDWRAALEGLGYTVTEDLESDRVNH